MDSIGLRSIFIRQQEIVDILLQHAPVYSEWLGDPFRSPSERALSLTTDEVASSQRRFLRYYRALPGTLQLRPFSILDNPWQHGALTWLAVEQPEDKTISEWQASARIANIEDVALRKEIISTVRRITRLARKEALVVYKTGDFMGKRREKYWITPGAHEFFKSGGRPSDCQGPGPWRGYPIQRRDWFDGYLANLEFYNPKSKSSS